MKQSTGEVNDGADGAQAPEAIPKATEVDMKVHRKVRSQTGKAKRLGKSSITEGGRCRCGTPLPAVCVDETPFEFCSEECKSQAKMCDALKGKVV